MCRVNGYAYGCGHTSYRFKSTCRGVHTLPNNPKSPRCTPTADLTFRCYKHCLDCRYKNFCDDWEDRIDRVKHRRDALGSLLTDFDVSEDSWGIEWNTAPAGLRASNNDRKTTHKASRPRSIDANESPFSVHSIRVQHETLSEEAERLEDEYRKTLWRDWKSFSGGMSDWAWNQATNLKARTPGARNPGSSPLKNVTNACDLPDEPESFLTLDDSDDEYPSDVSDDLSTLSAASIATPSPSDSYVAMDFSKFSLQTLTEETLRPQWEYDEQKTTDAWVKGLARLQADFETSPSHEDMLPDWEIG